MRKLALTCSALALGVFVLAGSATAQTKQERDEEAGRRMMEGIMGGIMRKIERDDERSWCQRNPWECRQRYRRYDPYYERDCSYDYRGRLRCY